MQQPTLQNVRVRSTRDALQIFYAVARGVIPMIARRLDAEERRAIAPGNVYIWEERCANAEITGLGMERWYAPFAALSSRPTLTFPIRTDGISWSASRIAQEFLFYRQRDSDQDSNHPSAQWANIMRLVTGTVEFPRSDVHSPSGDEMVAMVLETRGQRWTVSSSRRTVYTSRCPTTARGGSRASGILVSRLRVCGTPGLTAFQLPTSARRYLIA
jgi:hypothetical protein